MLTVHAAALVVPGAAVAPLADGAVAVDGGTVTAVGPADELARAHPRARTRHWPGLLTPGLAHRGASPLLEHAYHPDPREADTLGTAPLTGTTLGTLPLDDMHWGSSARRGLQLLLRHGVTAVAGPFRRPAVRTAVARAGVVRVADGDPEAPVPSLDPLAACSPAAAFAGTLAPGARADLAAFAVPDPAALEETGAACCVATVVVGRLAYRGRWDAAGR
ncbi:imidazolonepropionase-like domain-containing protein [Streptomyces sp. TR06-5]|uniref:imidazolonepropionase-like domain-containing protein n=1 Tax=Streptomyces sp. TR06-5 TaxID=3385976 RepID=UPI0039A1A427